MFVSDRIQRLREWMKTKKIDVCIVPTADYHNSEYVGDYFKFRQYLTGFTGSAGTAVVTQTEAGLWTDGRYFIQADRELAGSGIKLFRMGEPGVLSIEEYVEKNLPVGGTLAFDGRTIGLNEGKLYEESVLKKNGTIKFDCEPAEAVWRDRPEMPEGKAFLLEVRYAGESSASKLARIRQKMKEYDADVHILSSLDDIAWMLNIRGSDVAYCPLVLSYACIWNDRVELFADEKKFGADIKSQFEKDKILVRPYDEVYNAVQMIRPDHHVLLDPSRISCALYRKIPEGTKIIEKENPSVRMKCIKNDTEADNIRKAHLKDGIAHTKFLYWLKKNIGKSSMTENSVSEKLEEFRSEQEGYLGPSFEPISAFREHGAIVHYSATSKTDAPLCSGGLLLMDTGGHYLEGSTDITRTIALGEVSGKEKEHFTLVARAMLRLADTVFLHGCSGVSLDSIAREVFWKERVNFNHGTGHGVGYLLNIHEAPISFRWKEGGSPSCPFEKNMVITDEPGIYIEDSYGIRLENELMVQEDLQNEYGQFMRFEILTCVPIDLDAILPELMSDYEKKLLNDYNRMVYQMISPHLTDEEREWLEHCTRPV